MKRLSSMVTILENNEECTILKVRENQFANLISLGCFDGNETMFRLTKGDNHTCTVWGSNGSSFNWEWGTSGYTLVSDKVDKMGDLIQEAITDDFGIYIGSDTDKIRQTLYIEKPKPSIHHFKLMWWDSKPNDNRSVHKDGEYWKFFKSTEHLVDYLKSLGAEDIQVGEKYYSQNTGCALLNVYAKL